MAAGKRVKEEGLPNDLMARIAADPLFSLNETDLAGVLDPALYTGRSAEQTERFVREEVLPRIGPILHESGEISAEIRV